MKKKLLVIILSVIFLIMGCYCLIFQWLYPLKYKTEIVNAATQFNVSPALIAALINAESGFDKDKVSSKGAIGLMQILPTTASYIGPQNFDLFVPADNINIGVRYLAYLIAKFNDEETALFAYNAGEGNVARWLNENNKTRLTSCPFPETNAYVIKIKRSRKFYQIRF